MGPRRRLEQPQPSPPSPHRPGWRGALGGFYVLMQRQLRSARKIRHRAKAPRLCACWENSIPGRASESRGRLEIVSLMGTQGSPQGRGGSAGGRWLHPAALGGKDETGVTKVSHPQRCGDVQVTWDPGWPLWGVLPRAQGEQHGSTCHEPALTHLSVPAASGCVSPTWGN